MAESSIREYAQARGFHRQTLERWLDWQPGDQCALEELAVGLRPSENHLRDIMDWLEEISRRDAVPIHEILGRSVLLSLRTDPRFGRADKLKRIKDQIRRWRFPRLAAIEESVRSNIQELKLAPHIQMKVPAGLEGGRLQVELSAGSVAELEQLARRLKEAAATPLAAAIFDLLAGRRAGRETGEG